MITNIKEFAENLKKISDSKIPITEVVNKGEENQDAAEDANEEIFASELDKILAIGRK